MSDRRTLFDKLEDAVMMTRALRDEFFELAYLVNPA